MKKHAVLAFVAFCICIVLSGCGYQAKVKSESQAGNSNQKSLVMEDLYGKSSVEVTNSLGTPEKKSESSTQGYDGRVHQVWTYESKHISVNFADNNGEFSVISVTATSGCKIATGEGVCVGDGKQKIYDVYGSKISEDYSNINDCIYVDGEKQDILFHLENDVIDTITVGEIE